MSNDQQAAKLVSDGQLAPPQTQSGAASRSPSPRMRPPADNPAVRPDTPSSEDHPPLPPPPRVLPENPRSASPRTGGPRPLPNPFKTVVAPSRGDSGAESSEESAGLPPAKPSSKALGKRRAPPQDDARECITLVVVLTGSQIRYRRLVQRSASNRRTAQDTNRVGGTVQADRLCVRCV